MTIANGLTLPVTLTDGTTAEAPDVMSDFNTLLAALNRALLDSGGGAGMNAQNTQLHNLTDGSASQDATSLSQVNALIAAAIAALPASFPAGTALLFYQAAAPTGWTKSTANTNKALRVVSDTSGGSAGGSVAFTTAFASQAVSGTVGSHTLTTAEIPSHSHHNGVTDGVGDMFNHGTVTAVPTGTKGISSSGTGPVEGVTDVEGGGGGHTHSFTGTAINLAVQYINVIVCTKN